jgi:hypothetical protein
LNGKVLGQICGIEIGVEWNFASKRIKKWAYHGFELLDEYIVHSSSVKLLL